MSATSYELSFEQALGELQGALGRPVNVMVRPRDPAEQPHVIAHMSGRLMHAEPKHATGHNATRAAQGESLFFAVVPLGLDELVGLDGFYITENQFDGAMAIHGDRADRLHVRVGRFELLIAIARPADDAEADDDAQTSFEN